MREAEMDPSPRSLTSLVAVAMQDRVAPAEEFLRTNGADQPLELAGCHINSAEMMLN